jgi:tetratricopeptide (TPR) repeat protein
VADNPRIEELRRRVQTDPASIAFAQLAEEYRRAGHYNEAIDTCHSGLSVHPGYLSARVTLGRSLIEVNDLDAAEVELRQVLHHAPENLAAIRGLAEIHHRRGQLPEALQFYQLALTLARHDPDLEQTVSEITRALTPASPPAADEGMTFDEAQAEFLAALDGLEALGASDEPVASLAQSATADEPVDRPPAPVTPIASAFAPTAPIASAFAQSPTADKPVDKPASARSDADGLPRPSTGSGRPELVEGRDRPRPGVLELERFLFAIHAYRQRRAG